MNFYSRQELKGFVTERHKCGVTNVILYFHAFTVYKVDVVRDKIVSAFPKNQSPSCLSKRRRYLVSFGDEGN